MATLVTDTHGAVAPAASPPYSAEVNIAVLALPEHCYRCDTLTWSIVGFLAPGRFTDDPDGFIDFEILAPLLARSVTAAALARCGVGPIKTRHSRYRPEGYLSNGCINCDAIQGWFPLHERLIEFVAESGYQELIIGSWTVQEPDLSRQVVGMRGQTAVP